MAAKSEYKKKLLEEVEELSEPRLRAVLDFASFLREREEWGATLEILGDEEVMAAIQRSREAWAAGRTEEFVDLASVHHGAGRSTTRLRSKR